MAITLTALVGNNQKFGKAPSGVCTRFTLKLDNSYVAGGYAAIVATFIKGVASYEGITVTHIEDLLVNFGGAWYILHWDRANDKLQLIVAATGVEVAGGAAIGSPTVELAVHHY
jgi:hypothetical protein